MSASLTNLLGTKTKVQTSPLIAGSSKRTLLTDSEDATIFATTPSHVHLTFPTPVPGATHLALTFQGGFVATSVMVYVATRAPEEQSGVELGLIMGARIHPEDNSRRQIFRIPYPPNVLIPPKTIESLPTASTSAASLGPTIYTEVAPHPLGGGDKGPALDGAFTPASHTSTTSTAAGMAVPDLTEIKLEFEETSDNQGRVTLYQVEILG